MSPVYHRSRRGLGELFDDHSAEGISILIAEPSEIMRNTILVLFMLLFAGLAWSFYGRIDVMVESSGIVTTELQQRRVFVPIKGELANTYVTEGIPVAKGDILARVDSPNAIQLAGQAITAQLQYEDVLTNYRLFPEKKKVMEMQAGALKAKLDSDVRAHAKRVAESIAKLAEEQRLKLDKARAKLAKALSEQDHAKGVLESHERLFNSAGGGGLSRQQVQDKRKEFNDKVHDVRLAEAELGEFEISLGKEYSKKKTEIEQKSQQLMATRAQYESTMQQLQQEERKIETDLRMAKSRARSAAAITYDDIDEDNYLRIRAPIDGVVTAVVANKSGITVDDKTPIVVIAPMGSRKVLEIEILEKDRAFLKVGMQVKMKFHAFSYQRYGFINGELEYISPTTSVNPQTKRIYYKGRVGLEKDFYKIDGEQFPIRYGMGAKAEILVRKRRIVDLVLDPMRNIAG